MTVWKIFTNEILKTKLVSISNYLRLPLHLHHFRHTLLPTAYNLDVFLSIYVYCNTIDHCLRFQAHNLHHMCKQPLGIFGRLFVDCRKEFFIFTFTLSENIRQIIYYDLLDGINKIKITLSIVNEVLNDGIILSLLETHRKFLTTAFSISGGITRGSMKQDLSNVLAKVLSIDVSSGISLMLIFLPLRSEDVWSN